MNIINLRRWRCETGKNKKKGGGEIAICPSKWNQSETFKVTGFAKSNSRFLLECMATNRHAPHHSRVGSPCSSYDSHSRDHCAKFINKVRLNFPVPGCDQFCEGNAVQNARRG